jgi:hypothetical protein
MVIIVDAIAYVAVCVCVMNLGFPAQLPVCCVRRHHPAVDELRELSVVYAFACCLPGMLGFTVQYHMLGLLGCPSVYPLELVGFPFPNHFF